MKRNTFVSGDKVICSNSSDDSTADFGKRLVVGSVMGDPEYDQKEFMGPQYGFLGIDENGDTDWYASEDFVVLGCNPTTEKTKPDYAYLIAKTVLWGGLLLAVGLLINIAFHVKNQPCSYFGGESVAYLPVHCLPSNQ